MAIPFRDELKILPARDWADVKCAHDEEPLQAKDSEQVRRWLSSGESSGSAIKQLVPKRARAKKSARSKPDDEAIKAIVEKVVAPLRKEIADLQAVIKGPIAPEPGEFERWIRSQEAQKYAGEFIACTGPGKVVAHSPDNDDLLDLIANHPNRDELVVDLVPSAQN